MVDFFSPWKTSEEISCLMILSSAEAAGGFLSDLLYADTESIFTMPQGRNQPRNRLFLQLSSGSPEIALTANGSRGLSEETRGLVRAPIISGGI